MSIAPANNASRADPHIEQIYDAQKGTPHNRLPERAGIARITKASRMPNRVVLFILILLKFYPANIIL